MTKKTTNYEWKIGPDKDTSWYEAKEWVKNLGDGWRMPTLNELKELHNEHPNATDKWVWSCETKGSSEAWSFLFNNGSEVWDGRSDSYLFRGFAVRFRKENENENMKTAYKIYTTVGEITFSGKYRRDLEKTNWHYYEKEDGTILHFRKEHMVLVCVNNNNNIEGN